jgi:Predicted nucleotide-binding protein containing TIR-like domain
MSFVNDIRQFSISVDIVSENTYHDIRKLFVDYFSEKLGFNFVEVLKSEIRRTSHNEFLQTFWTFPEISEIMSDNILGSNGIPKTQTTYSYFHKTGYWIVSEGGVLLKNSDQYRDLWGSDLGDIPKYQSANQFNIATSVILPIVRQKSKVWGVINLESERASWSNIMPDRSDKISREIKTLVDAFSTITELYEGATVQCQNTRLATEELKKSLRLEKPTEKNGLRIFIASSSNADPEIIGLIKHVLDKDEFKFRIEPIFWQDLNQPGDIREQIWDELDRCSYGICYFSEPNKHSNTPAFVDNPNVIFEAGIQHAKGGQKKRNNWIPVREFNSPDIPFDIAGNRILLVKRLKDNSINREELIAQLTKTLREILV